MGDADVPRHEPGEVQPTRDGSAVVVGPVPRYDIASHRLILRHKRVDQTSLDVEDFERDQAGPGEARTGRRKRDLRIPGSEWDGLALVERSSAAC